jgi:MinD-like ATPase involved in chromosome partitioning or flagellar assembly
VVVNKCADQEEANSAFGNLSTAVSHFLGERIHNLGFISFNKEIHRSIINQELLADYSPASQSLAEITALTDSFNQFIQMVNNSHSQ